MKTISENRAFGGVQGVYTHASKATGTDMTFGLFMPAEAALHPVPVLWFLSGLTCTHENAMVKSGAQGWAAKHGIAVVFPDTSIIGIVEPELDAPFQFGPNPFGVSEDFGLTTEVALAQWVLLDGAGRRVMQGGALAPMGRLMLPAESLRTGWYSLQLTGADQRRWSLSLVRR